MNEKQWSCAHICLVSHKKVGKTECLTHARPKTFTHMLVCDKRTKQAQTNLNTIQPAGARTSCSRKFRSRNSSFELFLSYKICLH